MALDREVVQRIAALARLELSQEDEAAFTQQLGHILQYFEKLAELDTQAVEPTAHVVQIAEAYRDDVVTNLPATEELRANAPARDGDFFKVPKIIE
ncbi:MAG: Asp-tRNA(Asn)/Glu-tRNA(Gln) amidotransferase subunit GatC [Candidatus Binatia bacterium]|jgi:aspartyl-tRNA(Asn)/glutamyl-tRNA(Gln) amidotransferase subunit C